MSIAVQLWYPFQNCEHIIDNHGCIMVYVICTLSAVLCIPSGFPLGT